MWRIFQLNKTLSREGNVWSKFGTGHRESLSMAGKALLAQGKLAAESFRAVDGSLNAVGQESSRVASPALSIASGTSESDGDGGAVGRETRRRLVEWWSKEYCAGRMHLCVIGKGMSEITTSFKFC